MAGTFFVNSSTIGVDLNNQSTTQLFALGTHTLGGSDSEWVYVQANTSIVGMTMVAFNAAGTAGMASGGDIGLGNSLAVAMTSISSQAFGWVAVRGVGLTCSQTGTSSAASAISLAASAVPTGFISNQITASNTLAGITINATSTSTFATITLSWPRGFPSGA